MNMDVLDQQKAVRKAATGRMCLLFGGGFLLFTAITSTLLYGINFLVIASKAAAGTKEYVELLEKTNMQVPFLRLVGILFVILAVVEVFAGISSVRYSNRVDKATKMLRITLVLLVVEALMEVFLCFSKLMSLGMLFTAIGIPLFILWGAWGFRKLSKEDPKRVYAVDIKKRQQARRQAAAQPAAPKKSLRERAMMQADYTQDTSEEIQPEGEKEPQADGVQTSEGIQSDGEAKQEVHDAAEADKTKQGEE